MATTKTHKATTKGKSKIKIASLSLNEKVAKLLQLASSAPKQTFKESKSSAKLFELVVLADILEIYNAVRGPGTVRVCNAVSNTLNLAGSAASANKSVFSYFELLDMPNGSVVHEAWVSVEILTLSWDRANTAPPIPRSGKHEIDIGIFQPLPAPVIGGPAFHPSYFSLDAVFTCKHFLPLKESVREALGLRRETALLSDDRSSTAPWLVSQVPANPASPLFLVSSSAGVYAFQDPISNLGVYMMAVPFTT